MRWHDWYLNSALVVVRLFESETKHFRIQRSKGNHKMNTDSLVFWKKIKALANHAINVLEEPLDKTEESFSLLGSNHYELKKSLITLINDSPQENCNG